jgi:hypothetical protein
MSGAPSRYMAAGRKICCLAADHYFVGNLAAAVKVIVDADFFPRFDGRPVGRRGADTKDRMVGRRVGRIAVARLDR